MFTSPKLMAPFQKLRCIAPPIIRLPSRRRQPRDFLSRQLSKLKGNSKFREYHLRMNRERREHLELWEDLVRAHAAIVGRLEHEMEAEQGLPLRWYEVLLRLSRAPDGHMRMQDLAEVVLQSKSGLSRLIDRMEEAGLVSRQACPSDGRGINAALTPAGRHLFRRAAPLHVRGIEQHFGRHLMPAQAAALRSLLSELLEVHAPAPPSEPLGASREHGQTA